MQGAPPVQRRSRASWLLVVPVAAGLLASSLFVFQGGFGAGHGRFDQVLWLLGLPSSFLLLVPGSSAVLTDFDFVNIIALPSFINLLLLGSIIYFARCGRSNAHG